MDRWRGPIFGKQGKGASGQDLNTVIRLELGKLVNFMRLGNVKVHVWKKELFDGTIIQVAGNLNGRVPILSADVEVGQLPLEGNTYYMDSGFVQLLSPDGIIWQNSATRSLYGTYTTNDYFSRLRPEIGVDNGTTPPSFEGASKQTVVESQKPGNYTGKLKWLIAGQYGLKVRDSSFTQRSVFDRGFPANARLNGEGIYTDSDGSYWYMDIDDGGFSGTATQLSTELQSLVTDARANGVSGDTLIQLETHALAIAIKTNITIPMVFSGFSPVGLPLGYGWHFNETGSEAVIVTHQSQGGDDNLYLGQKYIAAIVKIGDQLSFTISKASSVLWKPSPHAVFWQSVETSEERTHCPLLGDGGVEEVADVIIYAYYDADDIIVDVLYSTSTDTGAKDLDMCGAWGHNTPVEGYSAGARNWASWSGNREINSIKINGEEIESKDGLRSYLKVSSIGTSTTTWTLNARNTVCCWGGADLIYYTGPCSTSTDVWPGLSVAPCYLKGPCPTGGNLFERCQVSYDRIDTTMYLTAQWVKTNGFEGTASSIAVIIPFDCANGVIVIKGDTSVVNRYQYDGTGPSGGVVRSRRLTQWDALCHNMIGVPCVECASTRYQDSGTRIVGLVTIDNITNTTWLQGYEANSERTFFHMHGHFKETVHVDSATDAFIGTDWDSWLAKWVSPEECGGSGAVIWQGIGTPAKCSANLALAYDIDGDFPESAEVVIGWA